MKRLAVSLTILSLLGTSAAFSQGAPHYSNGKPQYNQQYNNGHHGKTGPAMHYGKPGPTVHYAKPNPYRSKWSKGKPLPRNYRGNVVRDYSRYRLPPPRRDQQWVRVNNEYLLIGITSGIIASMMQGG